MMRALHHHETSGTLALLRRVPSFRWTGVRASTFIQSAHDPSSASSYSVAPRALAELGSANKISASQDHVERLGAPHLRL
jgi:hypothetical protein